MLTISLLLPIPALAQGFAGLGQQADGFAEVAPPAALSFPADHGPHPEYRIEWWYLTANLRDADGTEYGLQWTLFRQALEPGPQRAGWENQQVWMGHAGLTTADDHRHLETFARGGTGQAGARTAPFAAWIDTMEMVSTADEGDALSALSVTVSAPDWAAALEVATDLPLVPQGVEGFSVKSDAGQASYYYSQPFYGAEGVLTLDGVEVRVRGTAWLDREWSSQPLADDQQGWDWFSLQLDDGGRVMAFRLRGARDYFAGTWITPEGEPTPLAPDQIAMTELATARVAGRTVPVEWRVEIPDFGLSVETVPLNPNAWMDTSFPYWEGPITFTGSHGGRGYLEMTGY